MAESDEAVVAALESSLEAINVQRSLIVRFETDREDSYLAGKSQGLRDAHAAVSELYREASERRIQALLR